MGLQQFEQRLERLVEGAFAKAFRGELQPIELGKRLTREMDLGRQLTARGLVVPNIFDLVLSKDDFDRFGGLVDVLTRDLAVAARKHAKDENYVFVGSVEVRIGWSDEVQKSTIDITAEVGENEDQQPGWLVKGDGSRIEITEEPLTIGRLPDCDIPVADPNVSRRHAQFRREGEEFFVFDLGSTNGTKVNGAPVREHRLVDGDTVTVGVTTLTFESV